MTQENKHIQPENENTFRFTDRAKKIGLGVLSTVLAGGALVGLNEATEAPEMHGSNIVKIEPGNTVNEIANTEVKHGASHTSDVAEAIFADPENDDIFENGKTLGSEDLGKDLVVPEVVKED